MDSDTSLFETSEVLANLMVSTPLLEDSWRLCALANEKAPQGFVTEVIGGIGYLAFSWIQVAGGSDPSWGLPVQLESAGEGLFPGLKYRGEEDEEEMPVMVHAGFLRRFLDFHGAQDFQTQMASLRERSKSIVITGHSIGATIASLTGLWLLNEALSSSSSAPVLCITFGSPLLGNDSLSRAVVSERWSGSFCHVVSVHDIMPRLLFAPPSTQHLHSLLHLWQLTSIPDGDVTELIGLVFSCIETAAREGEEWSGKESFWPFGTYFFCSEEGVICMDNCISVVRMMHLLCSTNSPSKNIESHLKYGDYVQTLTLQLLKRKNFKGQEELSESSYEASVSLALESSGIDTKQETILRLARDCLDMVGRNGCARNLNVAHLAIGLARINPYRAQVQWYKEHCERSDDQLGYYDTFKQMRTNKREHRINMCRISLARFWDDVVAMWEKNELPDDFHRLAKWLNSFQSYKLLVEPLDIADYYWSNKHREKGNYIEHGRERRYRVFDKWWRDRRWSKGKNNKKRTKFACLTQDTLFWARVEEAKEWLESAKIESDSSRRRSILKRIDEFEKYAASLIERKEVSVDVFAENSSYTVWLQEWTTLKPQFQQLGHLTY